MNQLSKIDFTTSTEISGNLGSLSKLIKLTYFLLMLIR